MTEQEMLEEVFSWYLNENDERKELFKGCTESELVQYHSTLGRAIRNEFDL